MKKEEKEQLVNEKHAKSENREEDVDRPAGMALPSGAGGNATANPGCSDAASELLNPHLEPPHGVAGTNRSELPCNEENTTAPGKNQ